MATLTATPSELYLYGADATDLSAAFWIAMLEGIPAGNVTGDLNVATTWTNSSKPVIAVGAPALDNMMGADSSYLNFCNVQAWYNNAALGPIDGCGTTALDSLELSLAQIQAALAGTTPSTSITPCSYNGVSCTN